MVNYNERRSTQIYYVSWPTITLGLSLVLINSSDIQIAANFMYTFCRNIVRNYLATHHPVKKAIEIEDKRIVRHVGSCLCKAVIFYFTAPRTLRVKEGTGKIRSSFPRTSVLAKYFTLKQGKESLRVYHNDSSAAHSFCSQCGVHLLYAKAKSNTLYLNVDCLTPGSFHKKIVNEDDSDEVSHQQQHHHQQQHQQHHQRRQEEKNDYQECKDPFYEQQQHHQRRQEEKNDYQECKDPFYEQGYPPEQVHEYIRPGEESRPLHSSSSFPAPPVIAVETRPQRSFETARQHQVPIQVPRSISSSRPEKAWNVEQSAWTPSMANSLASIEQRLKSPENRWNVPDRYPEEPESRSRPPFVSSEQQKPWNARANEREPQQQRYQEEPSRLVESRQTFASPRNVPSVSHRQCSPEKPAFNVIVPRSLQRYQQEDPGESIHPSSPQDSKKPYWQQPQDDEISEFTKLSTASSVGEFSTRSTMTATSTRDLKHYLSKHVRGSMGPMEEETPESAQGAAAVQC
jgi:hypothetical protein